MDDILTQTKNSLEELRNSLSQPTPQGMSLEDIMLRRALDQIIDLLQETIDRKHSP